MHQPMPALLQGHAQITSMTCSHHIIAADGSSTTPSGASIGSTDLERLPPRDIVLALKQVRIGAKELHQQTLCSAQSPVPFEHAAAKTAWADRRPAEAGRTWNVKNAVLKSHMAHLHVQCSSIGRLANPVRWISCWECRVKAGCAFHSAPTEQLTLHCRGGTMQSQALAVC